MCHFGKCRGVTESDVDNEVYGISIENLKNSAFQP